MADLAKRVSDAEHEARTDGPRDLDLIVTHLQTITGPGGEKQRIPIRCPPEDLVESARWEEDDGSVTRVLKPKEVNAAKEIAASTDP